jgi:hypothetical protein
MGRLRRATLVLALPLALGAGNRAMQAHAPAPVDTSIDRYAADLASTDASDRLYAARVLRSQLRYAARDATRARPGSLRQDEALSALDDFEAVVAPACVDALAVRNIAHHCAAMLGQIGVAEARPALEGLLQPTADCSRRARRQARRALDRLPAALP